MPAGEELSTTLILGVGNVLMGDEGVGVVAARRLQAALAPGAADVIDGGTGGFHLLSLFRDYARIILIDAASDDHPPGTVRHLRPRFAADFPRTLSAHDIGLKDMIEAAAWLGDAPVIDLVTVSIAVPKGLGLDLSPEACAALDEVERLVRSLLEA
jgi:hydrogenase maturation protease